MIRRSNVETERRFNQTVNPLSDSREREIDAVVKDMVANTLFNLDPAQLHAGDVYRQYDYHCLRREHVHKILQARFKTLLKRRGVDDVGDFPGNMFNVDRFDSIKAVYYHQLSALYHFDNRAADNYRKHFLDGAHWSATTDPHQITGERRAVPFQEVNDPLIMLIQLVDARYGHLSFNPEHWVTIAQDGNLLAQHIATWSQIDRCLAKQKMRQHFSRPQDFFKVTNQSARMQARYLKNLDQLVQSFYHAWLHFTFQD